MPSRMVTRRHSVEKYPHLWSVIYNDVFENLTRPSRELFHIICDEDCLTYAKQ